MPLSTTSYDPMNKAAQPPLAAVGRMLPLNVFDFEAWRKGDLREKMRIGALSWAHNGMGAATALYLFYLLKHIGWYFAWTYFCGFAEVQAGSEGGGLLNGDSIQRLILWNMLFEMAGFGCASGALTGRFILPFCACIHWLWPGTIKLPYRVDQRDGQKPLLPFVGNTRTPLDVALFIATVGALLRALTAPTIGFAQCAPIVLLLCTLGLLDVTIFLAARAEVYLWMTVCMLWADSDAAAMWTGIKVVQLGIWLWAAVSKWGPWFQSTILVMSCNSKTWPMNMPAFHRQLFKNHPKDLTPSRLCKLITLFGASAELAFPLMLAFGGAGLAAPLGAEALGQLGLFIGCGFHMFILSQQAMGMPQEWNLFTLCNAAYLFGQLGGPGVTDLAALPLGLLAFLLFAEVALPLLGSFCPKYVSFLVAMRYYAGNWPQSYFVIEKSAYKKLHLVKSAGGTTHDQAFTLWGADGVDYYEAKLLAWLSLHLHGRLLPALLDKAMGKTADVREYHFLMGETTAGAYLGYNFGDGLLHSSYFLHALQQRCHFQPGELRQVFFDSCPLFGTKFEWFIRDATDAFGAIEKGTTTVAELEKTQPF